MSLVISLLLTLLGGTVLSFGGGQKQQAEGSDISLYC